MKNFKIITGKFLIHGEYYSCEPYGSGHIHSTFLLTTKSGGHFNNYILQKFNTSVFREPEKVLENIRKITTHLNERNKEDEKIYYLSLLT